MTIRQALNQTAAAEAKGGCEQQFGVRLAAATERAPVIVGLRSDQRGSPLAEQHPGMQHMLLARRAPTLNGAASPACIDKVGTLLSLPAGALGTFILSA
jgi:hypothetical protein